ncbi:MAG: transposase, partial [Candidatus Riflebacteria bacterium]|nr:transposase [Candidatus Riflebacteria bacterium]
RTVVMDAGIATEGNLAFLRERKWQYIVVNRGSHIFKPEDLHDMTVIRHDEKGETQVEVKRCQQAGETLLLCRSKGRVAKETGMRSRQETNFLDRLEYYRQGLSQKGHTKNYAKILEMIGRLREKYPGASKIYDVEVIPGKHTPGKVVQVENIIWKRRPGREQDEIWDGCYVLKTNRLDLGDREIWETYTMLTRIESAFRSLKASLGLRPNFHQKELRADAHLFISVLAYHILHIVEWKLRKRGDHRRWETIKQILSTHQRMTLEFQEKKHQQIEQCFIRLCSKPDVDQKMIYHSLGIRDMPLPRKQFIGL